MRKASLLLIVIACVLLAWIVPAHAQKVLDIYFLDMEGGGGTLVVSPSGESMLVDAGWNGARDADRIVTVAKQAGLKQIDYFVATHYHLDHIGGVIDLVTKLPIRTFVDYGEALEAQRGRGGEVFQGYLDARGRGRHVPVKAGGKVPVAGLDVQVVSAGGAAITSPVAGAGSPNPLCSEFKPRINEQAEDQRSVGIVMQYGAFRSMQLGDLTWNKEYALACPNNLLGTVDVYQTSAHGLNLSGPRALVHSLRPRVVIMNNAGQKGASPEAFAIVKTSPGLEDLWQVHYSEARAANPNVGETTPVGGKELNVADQLIANLDDTTAHFIRLSARQDGSFSVTNSRNGFTKEYKPRK
jgi:competence protein ComEC